MVILERRSHFIGYFREEAPFYWVNLGEGWRSFFYLCPKLRWRLAAVSFYGSCSTWRAGHLDQVILLVWHNIIKPECYMVLFYGLTIYV